MGALDDIILRGVVGTRKLRASAVVFKSGDFQGCDEVSRAGEA